MSGLDDCVPPLRGALTGRLLKVGYKFSPMQLASSKCHRRQQADTKLHECHFAVSNASLPLPVHAHQGPMTKDHQQGVNALSYCRAHPAVVEQCPGTAALRIAEAAWDGTQAVGAHDGTTGLRLRILQLEALQRAEAALAMAPQQLCDSYTFLQPRVLLQT